MSQKAVIVIEVDANDPEDFQDIVKTIAPTLAQNPRTKRLYVAIRGDAEQVLSVFSKEKGYER